jgi:hypothetical protein
MSKEPLLLDEPSSQTAQEELWKAYAALTESDKKRILNYLQKKGKVDFRYLAKCGGFPGGTLPSRIANRELGFGKKVDKFLKEHEEGSFGRDVLRNYLLEHAKTGPLLQIFNELAGVVTVDEFTGRLRTFRSENKDDSMAVMAACFFEAYGNPAYEWPTLKESPDSVNLSPDAEDDARDVGGSILGGLDETLKDLAELTERARKAAPWSDDDWSSVMADVKQAVSEVRDEVGQLSKDAGKSVPEWKSREELEDLLHNLRQETNDGARREKLVNFLKGLANEIRALTPLHRLPNRRQGQENARDASANEVESSCEAEGISWPEEGPGEPHAWLEWVMQLDGESLQRLIEQLQENSYPKTALLVEDLERNYEIGGSTTEDPGNVSIPPAAPSVKNLEVIVDTGGESPDLLVTEDALQTTDGIQGATAPPPAGGDVAVNIEEPQIAIEQSSESIQAPEVNPMPSEPVTARDEEGIRPDSATPTATHKEGAQEPGSSDASHGPLGELADAAKAALHAAESEIEPAIEKVVWLLLARNELTLAFQILRDAYDTGLTSAFPVPPSFLEILALLPAYSSSSSEVPHHIRTILHTEDVSGVFKSGESETNEIRRMLVASILLRPSLFDPSSNAGSILDGVRLGHLSGIRTIQQALTEFGKKGVNLNATILSATLNTQGWKEKENELVEQMGQFLESAINRKMNYAPATWIWRHWFQDQDGWMRGLFTLAASHERKSLERLGGLLKETDVEMEIRRGWRDSKGRGDLVGSALESLNRLAGEALDLLRHRLDHWISGAQSGADYRQKVVAQLAETISANLCSAESELAELIGKDPAGHERRQIAAQLMRGELGHLKEALSGTLVHIDCPNLDRWLNADLLRLDSIELDESVQVIAKPMTSEDQVTGFWREDDPVRQRLALKLQALQKAILEWKQAFDGAISRSDHRAARWILDQMARNPEMDCTTLEIRKTSHAEQSRNRLRRELKSVESKVVSAFSKGWLTPEVHASNMERVQKKIEDLSHHNDNWQNQPFHEWFREVEEVNCQIDLALKQQVQTAETSLKSLTLADPNDVRRVRRILENGDVQLASEYIQKLEAGESIDDAEELNETNHYTSLYGDVSQTGCFGLLMECLDAKSPPFDPNKIISELQHNDTWCGIDLRRLDPRSRSECASAMQRWFGAQKSRRIDENNLEAILNAFDLPVSTVNREREGFVLRLAEDIICPIPDFGSEIRSRKITVQVEMQRSSVDDVVQHLDRMKLGMAPTILLWMRPVPMQSRRKFSRLCRQKSMKVLLIDTVLAAYILTTDSPRVRALFECGLPFTNVTPYTTTGGTLPEEMFFGRRTEIEAIESAGPAGTCFVYGGRQIGKTVLLRKVERDFPRRGTNHVALYLDLNFHAVGQTVPMDEIWRIVADELTKKESSIFGKTPRTQFSVEEFAKHVTHWLNEDEGRRILLLLDEADRFLQADGDTGTEPRGMPFRICVKLKGLMDETHRRFKVVFAGLHNVQRSTRVANNPLAQLGIPVCVGPLYQNGESREASRLVSIPLSASGVFFDSADTINTILARTNYYPNLIQIFCSRLLTLTVDKQSRALPDQTPPFQVTSDDVESVFMKHEIRDEIRKKFMLTLDLDRRFSLIANYMAWMAKEFPGGFTVDDIQRDAVPWWPQGFEADRPRTRDSLHEDLSVLLNEMCGLGILRRDANDHFFLRSPNVVALLGSPKEIEKVLESAATWETPPPYSPDSFRRPTAGHGDHFHWRSCLTARQETLIRDPKNSVIVISGCQASGIEEVIPCLELAVGSDYLVMLPKDTSLEQFKGSFAKLSDREKQAGKTVVLVPAMLPWNIDWILAAKKAVGRFTAKDRPVGVVFLADANLIWCHLTEWKGIVEEVGTGLVRLQRWDNGALRQWFTDSGLLFDGLPGFFKATGGWHEAIRRLGEFARESGSFDFFGESEKQVLDVLRSRLSLKQSFGFPDELFVRALKVLAELGESVSNQDLTGFCSHDGLDQGINEFAPTLEWAEWLGIVDKGDKGWLLDELVANLLKSTTAEA